MTLSLKRGMAHLRNGTLLDRLRSIWWLSEEGRREHRVRVRTNWWRSQTGVRDYFETGIQTGVQMRLYFDSRLAQNIHCENFEWQEREFLNRFLRPGDIYVDVGANIGLFTLIAARCIGPEGRVYAFEPSSRTYERLLENVALNKFDNVSTHKVALSDRAAQLEMTISLDGFDAWNSLAQPIDGKSFAVETITSTTWDAFAEGHDLAGRVTMMKIDVEGWEKHVLAGGAGILSREDAPTLQVEFTEQAARSANSSCAELYHMLEELGYSMFIYDTKAKNLIPDPIRDDYPYLNLIATKKPVEVAARLKGRSRT